MAVHSKRTTHPGLPLAALACLALAFACTGSEGGEDGEGSETEGSADPFVFAEDDPSDYVRVDRLGMPAVGTAVIVDKQGYNESSPAEDLEGVWVQQITSSLEGMHAALDDDLADLGLTPCAVEVCVTQAAPLVVPDTLKIDLSMDAGFPNGRRLEDPVIDVTLAVVLLDLSVEGQTPLSFVGALNPTENDMPFEASFPYVAMPHTF